MHVVCSKHLLNGLHQIPKLPAWEFSRVELHIQYLLSKPGRKGQFCYWHFFSAWPLSNLNSQTSPRCLIEALTWAAVVSSILKPLQGTLEEQSILWHEVETRLFFEVGSIKDLNSPATQLLQSSEVTITHNMIHLLSLPQDCCLGLKILKWFTHVITQCSAKLKHCMLP